MRVIVHNRAGICSRPYHSMETRMSKSAPSGIPGMDAMTDTFDFFKNMWSGMPGMNLPGMKNIPGMVMPTLSVDEIDKQIKDLKAVESWLTFNLNLLQGTIQALEVQKATISTLQTMSETFTAAMQPAAAKETPAWKTPVTDHKPAFESPFAPKEAAKPEAAKQEAPKQHAPKQEAPAATPDATSAAPGLDAGAIPPLANPAAWWGMLQDQFKQAVNTAAAMTPEAPAAAPAKEEKKATAAPRKRKTPPKA
jgi:hypothetical protein